MNTSLKFLGLIAMLSSPFLWIETYLYRQAMHDTSLTGVSDLIYMIGWSCSIIALMKLGAAGENRRGKTILVIQLTLLSIANIWNIWVIIDPLNQTTLFIILDKFWPISNLFMLVTGIAVVVAKKLDGFSRFVPLTVGLWLPISAASSMILSETQLFYFMNSYSFAGFFLLGLMIFKMESYRDETLAVDFRYQR
jgi:hypothetical protein